MDLDSVSVHKRAKKRTWPISSHLDRTNCIRVLTVARVASPTEVPIRVLHPDERVGVGGGMQDRSKVDRSIVFAGKCRFNETDCVVSS